MDCAQWGFVSQEVAGRMYLVVEELRASNAWGLPSLPYPYALIITFMVKVYLIIATLEYGYDLSFFVITFMDEESFDFPLTERLLVVALEICYLFVINLLYQGLLDLHSILRNPNQDKYIGHLCTRRFLNFTSEVSHNLINNVDRKPQWRRPMGLTGAEAPKPETWGRMAARESIKPDEGRFDRTSSLISSRPPSVAHQESARKSSIALATLRVPQRPCNDV